MKITDKTQGVRGSRVRAVAVGATVLALVGAGGAVAAGQIDSRDIANNSVKSVDIKNGTIQTRDLTKNNFARFTRTENVVSATTPASTTPAYNGARVVDVNGATPTTLVTVVLDEGTWELDVVAQFRHFTGGGGADTDYGVVTITPALQDGFSTGWTPDVPNGGVNVAQVAMSGTIKITANDTPVLVQGQLNGATAGQAGASVQATQIAYVKQPRS